MNLGTFPAQLRRAFVFAALAATVLGAAPVAAATLAAGNAHSVGVKTDGSVAAWGDNVWGQCYIPADLTGVIAVAAGSYHTLALKADASVVAWGYNWYGQCNVPGTLGAAKAVAAGNYHSLALRVDGTVVAWGSNTFGQCTVPADLTGVVAVAAGYNHSLALKADGSVMVWGDNTYGQCNVPAGLSGVQAVAAGSYHNLALKSDGTVVAWGADHNYVYGQCNVPAGLSNVVAVAAGFGHSLALKADGTMVAWGMNSAGQCNIPAGLSDLAAVAAGFYHSLALKADGTAVAWGKNSAGQCLVPAVTFKVPNIPPLADAGDNITILSKNQPTAVLYGLASDPDNDALTYRWLEGSAELTPWQAVPDDGQAPLNLGGLPYLSLGQHTLTLEVSDGRASTKDDTILTVENTAPTAGPSGAGTFQVNTPVTLGGQIADYDGDQLTYQWLAGATVLTEGVLAAVQGGEPVSLPDYLVANLEVGSHEFTLRVSDGVNAPVTQSVTVEVIDTIAPTLAPVADKTILWPPNHKMVPVSITANAGDNSGQPLELKAAVSCNEPLYGAPYWTEPVIDQAKGIITLHLQADSLGKGKGRQYTISLTATDQSGNASTANVVVAVSELKCFTDLRAKRHWRFPCPVKRGKHKGRW